MQDTRPPEDLEQLLRKPQGSAQLPLTWGVGKGHSNSILWKALIHSTITVLELGKQSMPWKENMWEMGHSMSMLILRATALKRKHGNKDTEFTFPR